MQSDWDYGEMEKKADQFADKYSAEFWCTSSRTGEYHIFTHGDTLLCMISSEDFIS